MCDSSPADIDNSIKPIQDALVGVVLADDFQVTDVDSHRRFLSGQNGYEVIVEPSSHQLPFNLGHYQPALIGLRIEPALLYLWSTVEAILRKRAIAQNLPIARFPQDTLLNHMYSRGELSIDEFDEMKAMPQKRNAIAHGLVTFLETDEIEEVLTVTRSLVTQWQSTDH